MTAGRRSRVFGGRGWGWAVALAAGVLGTATLGSRDAAAQTAPAAAPATAAASPTAASTTTAGPSTTAAGASAPAAAPTTGELDGSTYRVRLRDLEQQVDELKEQIRRSHTRLSLLSDTILSGAAGGARADVVFVNELSGAWQVIEATFVLDGAVQYKKSDDSGVLAAQKEIPIFSGSIPGGSHTLQVMLKLRGHGFGVFSYLSGLEATVRHDHSFTVTDGKQFSLKATAWEQGGPTTPVEEQPAIRFGETVRAITDVPKPTTEETAPPAQPASAAQPAPAAPATPSAGASGAATSTPSGGAVSGGASLGGK